MRGALIMCVPVRIYRHHHPAAVHQVARSVCLGVILALASQDAVTGYGSQDCKP